MPDEKELVNMTPEEIAAAAEAPLPAIPIKCTLIYPPSICLLFLNLLEYLSQPTHLDP